MHAEEVAAQRQNRPERQEQRKQFLAIQEKLNAGGGAAEVDVRLPPAINEVVKDHSKWLMKKLYDSRVRNGDITFIFKSIEEEIPVPAHALAAESGGAARDVVMRDESNNDD